MGATVRNDGNKYIVEAENLKGANIYLDIASVGATINIMLAAVKAKGTTVIENAALELSLKDAKVGQSFQFEREGYFCVDSKYSVEGKPQFNLTVPLRETKKEF